ncbi:hypothetical protein BEQ56_00670 [Anaerolineaceae bacterium oral taxon 439]|nr:hypothetical protein BEQ56_00670 [Anaerolineaceae bacterium oral taxon 439]
MKLFDEVKAALRVSTEDAGITGEIRDLIGGAKRELRRLGVQSKEISADSEVLQDEILKRAVILYAKAHFGFSEDQEKYLEIYEKLKGYIAISYADGGG